MNKAVICIVALAALAATIGFAPAAGSNGLSMADLDGVRAGARSCSAHWIFKGKCAATDTCVTVAPPVGDGGHKCNAVGAACTKSDTGDHNDECTFAFSGCCTIDGTNIGNCAAILNGNCAESTSPPVQLPGIPPHIPPIGIPRLWFCKCNGSGGANGMSSQTYIKCN